MSATSDPRQNHLLAALSGAELAAAGAAPRAGGLPLGEVLYESGPHAQPRLLPDHRIVSLLYVMENGASAEIAVVGNEGVVGVSLFMGGETTPSRAVVQSAGHGYRLPAQRVKDEFTAAARCST